jgi:hypothetical protein
MADRASMDEQQTERLRALFKSGRDKYQSFFAVLEEVRQEIGDDALPKFCVEELGIGLSVITQATGILHSVDAKIARSELAVANEIAKEQRRAIVRARKETPRQSQAPVETATNRSLKAIAQEILKHESNAIAGVIAIGGLLVEAEAQCQHGEYMPWLTANFQWSHQTSLRYRRLFQLTQNQHSVDFGALNISLSALYYVADCPKGHGIDRFGEAIGEMIAGAMAAIIEAAKTQRVSLSIAQNIFREIMLAPEDEPDPDDDDLADSLPDEIPAQRDVTPPTEPETIDREEGTHTGFLKIVLRTMITWNTKASDAEWLEQIEDNPVEFYKFLDHMIDLRSKREAANSPIKMKADRAEAKAKNGRQ